MRRTIEAADRAHDDTGALGAGLDSYIRRSVAQIGDEVHALIGHRNVEPIRGATHQCLRQGVALFAILLAHTANVRSEMALLHELGNDRLLQRRRLAIDEIARADKSLEQGVRHHGVTAARLEPDQALGAQLQQALADRGGADAQVLRHGLRADEVPAAQLAGDDQVADVRRGLGAELRAVTAVPPRPVRRLLIPLGQGVRVPGNGLSTALREPGRSGRQRGRRRNRQPGQTPPGHLGDEVQHGGENDRELGEQ